MGQAWEVNSLTWSNQPTDHYGLGYQQAATVAGEPLSYDITEEAADMNVISVVILFIMSLLLGGQILKNI